MNYTTKVLNEFMHANLDSYANVDLLSKVQNQIGAIGAGGLFPMGLIFDAGEIYLNNRADYLAKCVSENLKEFEVWLEGYSATGDSGLASFQGKFKGLTFKHVCLNWSRTGIDPDLFNLERLTYWGCRLYDNEKDARKNFG